jgi:hypothetical protein
MRWWENPPLTTRLLFCLFFLVRSALAADNSKPISIVDLTSELCGSQFQQENIPMAGVSFVDDNDVLVYTVCHVNIALSLRGRFQETDPYHLKAAIVDTSTGAIKKHFDLPTHSHESSILVTHEGNLLIHRDNVLELFDPQGKRLAASRIDRTSLYLFVEASPTNSILNLVDFTDTFEGKPNSVTVLDSRNFKVLSQWHDDGDSTRIASSLEATVRTVANGSLLVMRNFNDSQWTTLLTGPPAGILRPTFVSDSEFAVPVLSQRAVLLFDKAGKVAASVRSSSTVGMAVSRDGHVLGVVWALQSFVGPDGRPVGPQTGIRFYDIPSLTELGSMNLFPPLASDFTIALSPHCTRLAILDHLTVSTIEVPIKSSR